MHPTHAPTVDAATISLFLDVDGTLIEIADRPDAVVVGDALIALLDRLHDRLDGRVALISGRSLDQLDTIIGPIARRLTAVGSHGAETRVPGQPPGIVERPAVLTDIERAFRSAIADQPGCLVETKTLGVALHYRVNPDFADTAMTLAERYGAADGLMIQKGKMMVELRTAGHDKGSSIAALMQQQPFAGHVPVFLGDDVTDEPGFERCSALGGFGILVGAPRDTAAAYRVADVAAVHDWLRAV